MFKCIECTYNSKFIEEIHEHEAEKHAFVQLSSFIGEKTQQENKFLEQVKSMKDIKFKRKITKNSFNCNEEGCEYSTKLKQHLKSHKEIIHLQIQKFSCNICHFKSYYKSIIASHQKDSQRKLI